MEEEENDTWLQELESNHAQNSFFYKSPVTKITLYILLINGQKELYQTKKHTLSLSIPNKITKNELVFLISNHKPQGYNLLDILMYQMSLSSNDLLQLDTYDGLRSQSCIEDINFEHTMDYFNDLNSLYFLFYEKKKSTSTTRRVHFSNSSKNRKSRRVVFNS